MGSLASTAGTGNPHESIATTSAPLSRRERVRVRGKRPPPHPHPFSHKERREQITLNDIFQQNREVSCLPLFLPFHLTRCSLPHAQQVQPTLSPSITPVPVSSLYPSTLLAQHALSLLASHFALYSLLPLCGHSCLSHSPPTQRHCCLFGKSNLMLPSFLPTKRIGILAPFSRRESSTKELLCHWRYLPLP
ncbi:hypothetical protein HNP10_002516 [Aeromonas veronii]|nr:hypothetical protein [Aeromonas veronii]